IVTDEYGQPHVGGAWAEATGVRPSLSLTHVDGLALALVGDAAHYAGVGVDVERVSQRPESFDEVGFTPEERELLSPLDPSLREEWSLRLWCAKEAAAKAFGRGMMGGARNLVAQRLAAGAGVVEIALTGELAAEFPGLND